MIRTVFLTLITLALSSTSFGQLLEPQTPNTTPIYNNIAWTGTGAAARANYSLYGLVPTDIYGFQNAVSYDQYVAPLHGGLGVQYVNENVFSGDYTFNRVRASYAFHQSLTDELSLSAAASVEWQQQDFNGLVDPQGVYSASFSRWVPAVAVIASFTDAFVGYQFEAARSLYSTDTPIEIMTHKAHAGYFLSFNDTKDKGILIAGDYQWNYGYQTLNFQSSYQSQYFRAGAQYRFRNAASVNIGTTIKKIVRIDYCHSFFFSPLTNANRWASQLSIGIDLPYAKNDNNFFAPRLY